MARSRITKNQVVDVDFLSEPEHLVLDHSTVASGIPRTLLELNDTPVTYSGSEDKHIYVNSDGDGLNFRYISDDDNYTEITYTDVFPIQIDVYIDSSKIHKVSSTAISRVSGKVSQTVKSIYDIDTGTSIVGVLTTTINRVDGKVVSTTNTRT